MLFAVSQRTACSHLLLPPDLCQAGRYPASEQYLTKSEIPSTNFAPRSTSILQKRPSPHPQSRIFSPDTLPQASSIGPSSSPLRVALRPSRTSLIHAGASWAHSRFRLSVLFTEVS